LTIAAGGNASAPIIFSSTIACSPIGCFATSCATSFIGGTMSGTTIYGSTAVCSAVGKFTSCIDAGTGYFSSNVTAVRGFFNSGGNATDPIISVTGDTNTGFFFPSADAIATTTGGCERMRITSGGNVGIGTNSPADLGATNTTLTINGYGGNAGILNLQSNGTNGMFLYSDTSGTTQYEARNLYMRFGTNNTERMTITSTGISCFACTICAPIVSVGSCLLINQTCSLLDVTTKVEMSGVGSSSAYTQASYNVFANHGTNSTWIGYLNFNKSRGTTQGSVTATANGDRIGMVRFSAADGTEQIRATEIYSEVDGAVSKCCVPGRIIFATTGNNLDGPIERFRISSAGVACFSSTVCAPVVFASTSIFSSTYYVNSYNSLSSTLSGQMGVLGHNAISCQQVSNTIAQMNNGYYGSFIRQYYNEGITFYTRANAGTAGDILYGTSPVADGGERLRITSTGIACFACQICATSGIKFGSGATSLNYYEQGTFSPAFAGSTSGCGVPSGGNAALGYYTRIGNQVFLTVAVNSSTFPSYSGDLRMYLPFTACDGGGLSSVTYHGPPIYFYPYANWGSSYCINDITTYILGANNYLGFNIYGLGTDRQNAVTSANTNLSGQAGIYTRFSINYTAV